MENVFNAKEYSPLEDRKAVALIKEHMKNILPRSLTIETLIKNNNKFVKVIYKREEDFEADEMVWFIGHEGQLLYSTFSK